MTSLDVIQIGEVVKEKNFEQQTKQFILEYIDLHIYMKQMSQERFYQTQNISIRKNIRQLDLMQASEAMSSIQDKNPKLSHLNLMIVGPQKSGKTSLLRTIYYALNGTQNLITEAIVSDNIRYERGEIKRNKKNIVKGCSQYHKTQDKFRISSVQISNIGDQKLPYDKYRKATFLLQGKIMACLKEITLPNSQGINFVLICTSPTEKLSNEELTGLRFLIAELDEKHVPYLVIGSKIDTILGRFKTVQQSSIEQLQYLQSWKEFIGTKLCCSKSKIYLMENYTSQNVQNSETINFYALNLLSKIIKILKANEIQAKKNRDKFKFFICSC